jgi:hypothetical protein
MQKPKSDTHTNPTTQRFLCSGSIARTDRYIRWKVFRELLPCLSVEKGSGFEGRVLRALLWTKVSVILVVVTMQKV